MGDIVKLRRYTNDSDITHVMYKRQEIENIYICETCGELQVIDGIVWHIKPDEDHNA